MALVTFEVRYLVYRGAGNPAHKTKIISLDEKVYDRNRYSHSNLEKVFYPIIATDHPKAYKINVSNFRKFTTESSKYEKSNISRKKYIGDDEDNYSNIWNLFKKPKPDPEQPPIVTVKPSKSIWRSPRWMIPFRIIWYLIKKIVNIALWLMEGNTKVK